MSMTSVLLIVYILMCIVAVHVAINYLCSVHATRPINKKDIFFAIASVFLNIIVLLIIVFLDKKAKRETELKKANYEKSVKDLKDALSVYIPYFDKKRHTVAALLYSGNAYAYILGKSLQDNGKELSYTLTEQDIYDHGHFVLSATKVEIISAKYDQELLNKRDLNK